MVCSIDTGKPSWRDILALMCPWGKIPMLDNLRHNNILPLCWYSMFRTSGWMSRSEFVLLFGFRYAFPCLGWMQVLPLPYGQIRIISWINFCAHFDIREQDCNRKICENILYIHAWVVIQCIYFHLTWKETTRHYNGCSKHERNI